MSKLIPQPGRRSRPFTVLAGDDDRFIREILRNIFESEPNVTCLMASDGAQGLELLESQEADLAFVDIRMQPMNGFGFCAAVRSHKQLFIRKMPVVLMTTEADRMIISQARFSGVNGFCLKPLNYQKVLQRAKAAMQVNASPC